MGRQTEARGSELDVVEETRLFTRVDGEWEPISGVKDSGTVRILTQTGSSGSASAVEITGEDEEGNILSVGVETLDQSISTSEIGFITYLVRALSSVGQDEIRVTSPNDLDVNISAQSVSELTTTLNQALDSVGGDEVRVVSPSALDVSSPNPLDVSAAEVDVDINAQSLGAITTTVNEALTSVGNDEVRTDIRNSAIQVPSDIQSILPKSQEVYGADLTVQQQIKLEVSGFKFIELQVEADTATDITVEYSWDDATYYEQTSTNTASYNETFQSAAQWVRLTTAGAGAGGDLVDLIIGAKP